MIYDNEDSTEVDVLVYAEDQSSNGTYWNGSLIGRGNCGYLLSNDDVLKLSPNTSLRYQAVLSANESETFDLVQENEMRVSSDIEAYLDCSDVSRISAPAML